MAAEISTDWTDLDRKRAAAWAKGWTFPASVCWAVGGAASYDEAVEEIEHAQDESERDHWS